MDAMPRPTVDWIRDFMHTPVNHKPGTAFMYNSTGSSILGAIVRKKTGEGLQEYLSKRLFLNRYRPGQYPLVLYAGRDGKMGGSGYACHHRGQSASDEAGTPMAAYGRGERILAEDYVRLATTNQMTHPLKRSTTRRQATIFLGYGFPDMDVQAEVVYTGRMEQMGQFNHRKSEQDLLIAINETAVGAH